MDKEKQLTETDMDILDKEMTLRELSTSIREQLVEKDLVVIREKQELFRRAIEASSNALQKVPCQGVVVDALSDLLLSATRKLNESINSL